MGLSLSGSGLSVTASGTSAASITVATTTVAGGVDGRVLFDNAGALGEYSISGTGAVAMTNTPTFVTPVLGAATGTSVTLTATVATGAPAGSSAGAWKLGALQTGAVIVDTTRSIYVDIGGVVYKLIVAA